MTIPAYISIAIIGTHRFAPFLDQSIGDKASLVSREMLRFCPQEETMQRERS
jgi:hypothetical protein